MKMTQTEITAEVFKVIRANEYINAKQLLPLIKEHLPDISDKELSEALLYLYKQSE